MNSPAPQPGPPARAGFACAGVEGANENSPARLRSYPRSGRARTSAGKGYITARVPLLAGRLSELAPTHYWDLLWVFQPRAHLLIPTLDEQLARSMLMDSDPPCYCPEFLHARICLR